MLLVDRLGGVEQMPDARTRASALVLRDVNHVRSREIDVLDGGYDSYDTDSDTAARGGDGAVRTHRKPYESYVW